MASRHKPQTKAKSKPQTKAEKPPQGAKADRPADEAPPAAAAPEKPTAPLCPYHKEACVAGRSEAYFTRYYCKKDACSYSEKVPRRDLQARLRRDRDAETDHNARP